MVALRLAALLCLSSLGCGCSDETRADSPLTGGSNANSEQVEESGITVESRAVIEFWFLEMTASGAEEIRKRLEQADNVEKVNVDLDSKKAKCLMKEWSASSDAGAAIKALEVALGESYPAMGSGSTIHATKSESWSKLKLKFGW